MVVYKTIDEANQAVVNKVIAGSPFLLDVVPAHTVIDEFNHGKLLLHAGPPITFDKMIDPVQGACIGAALFEGWADNEDDARQLLESGEVQLMPCHHVNAVGPMGGDYVRPHAAVGGGKPNRRQPRLLHDEQRYRGGATFRG